MIRLNPEDARLIICESSPIVGNQAIALYLGAFHAELGTFPDRATARSFAADLQALVTRYGGGELVVEDDGGD